MSSQAQTRTPSETIDERTIRLLYDEISELQGQAGQASDREVVLAASLVAAENRLLDSGVMLHEVNHRAKNSIQIAMSVWVGPASPPPPPPPRPPVPRGPPPAPASAISPPRT